MKRDPRISRKSSRYRGGWQDERPGTIDCKGGTVANNIPDNIGGAGIMNTEFKFIS